MNHSNKKRTFSREMGQRDALIKTLAVSLLKLGKIKTTEAKAKTLRSYVEKLVTKGKEHTLNSHRLIAGKVGAMSANKIAKDIAPKYKDRKGGYLRITKLQSRINDGAKMVLIEFV
jgi:large subunit ribosomal protein L17